MEMECGVYKSLYKALQGHDSPWLDLHTFTAHHASASTMFNVACADMTTTSSILRSVHFHLFTHLEGPIKGNQINGKYLEKYFFRPVSAWD